MRRSVELSDVVWDMHQIYDHLTEKEMVDFIVALEKVTVEEAVTAVELSGAFMGEHEWISGGPGYVISGGNDE